MTNTDISKARRPKHTLVNMFPPGHPLLACLFLWSVFIYTPESKR